MLSQFTLSSFLLESLREIIKDYYSLSSLVINLDNLKVQLNSRKRIITYQTLIYQLLEGQERKKGNDFANSIAIIYHQNYPEILVNVSDGGWLEFIVNDRILIQWLNKLGLIRWNYFPAPESILSEYSLDFNNYYIASRFASILRSAHEQKIITINNLDFSLNNWQIESMSNIFDKIVFNCPSYEYSLCQVLLLTIEMINSSRNFRVKPNYINCISSLSASMKKFESNCRVWGKVKKQNLLLSQSRLSLMAIALHYYQNLFYRQFGQELLTKL